MIVHISAEAKHDLRAIGDYIARDNPDRAIGFMQELRAQCLELADQPEIFPLVPRYERHGIRRKTHGNYLIFYRIEKKRVVVIHVLHGARDYLPILGPEPG